MSQLNDTLERICTIQKTITIAPPAGYTGGSAVQNAFPYPVADPTLALAPFFFNEYNGGPSTLAAVTGLQQIISTVTMVLCVTQIESEYLQADVYRILAYWRDSTLAAFANKVRLGNDLSYITEVLVTAVGAFQKIPIGSAEYGGMAFTLRITEQYPTTIRG